MRSPSARDIVSHRPPRSTAHKCQLPINSYSLLQYYKYSPVTFLCKQLGTISLLPSDLNSDVTTMSVGVIPTYPGDSSPEGVDEAQSNRIPIPSLDLSTRTSTCKTQESVWPAAHYPSAFPIISPRSVLQVFAYSPFEGGPGVPVTVNLDFFYELSDPVRLRLVLGDKALTTEVRHLWERSYGQWELTAVVPRYDRGGTSTVALVVHAVNSAGDVIDLVTVGPFTYEAPVDPVTHLVVRKRSREDVDVDASNATPFKRRMSTRDDESTYVGRVQTLMRTTQLVADGQNGNEHTQAVLEICSPLDSLCSGWDASELHIGRRLVRFTRAQEGHKVKVACERITQDQYDENDIVVSCIYRQETNDCYITSVDILHLLERLADQDFSVEEKNRIRRNLEGFKPTTVSKKKADQEEFFQRIMDFPSPKPRTIEKDLKVFEWSLLSLALEKIISKYSFGSIARRSSVSGCYDADSGATTPPLVYPSSFETDSGADAPSYPEGTSYVTPIAPDCTYDHPPYGFTAAYRDPYPLVAVNRDTFRPSPESGSFSSGSGVDYDVFNDGRMASLPVAPEPVDSANGHDSNFGKPFANGLEIQRGDATADREHLGHFAPDGPGASLDSVEFATLREHMDLDSKVERAYP